jgi:alkanesulfonate monooxygenase SsuD/methylene tetrahydromethanopterin reductase-like flavin-dependent oxidoreductase (luciferase family)
MPIAVLILPILPDKEEEWRRFTQDLLGDRLDEYEGLGRRLGIRGVRVYLTRASRREGILAYVEAEKPEEAFRRLVASEEPFIEWFKEKVAELHGYDLGRPRMRPFPELIFEHPGDYGDP